MAWQCYIQVDRKQKEFIRIGVLVDTPDEMYVQIHGYPFINPNVGLDDCPKALATSGDSFL